jgi:hypothetical protein
MKLFKKKSTSVYTPVIWNVRTTSISVAKISYNINFVL